MKLRYKTNTESSFNCDLCEKYLKNERLLKIHKHTHSYHSIFLRTILEEQLCKKYEFNCKNIGNCNLENYECGLCDDNFDTLEDLEIHLNTCNIYECNFGDCLILSKI